MEFSTGLINGVKHFEGLRLRQYRCPTGHLTIGYGHLCRPDQVVISEEDAEAFLRMDLYIAADGVSTISPLLSAEPPHRLEALASWAFNLGVGSYEKSTLRKRVDAGNWAEAEKEITRWVYGTVNGRKQKLPGLVRRRAWEAQVFGTGKYDL